jgi:hypothetical protein
MQGGYIGTRTLAFTDAIGPRITDFAGPMRLTERAVDNVQAK